MTENAAVNGVPDDGVPFISRVRLKNYKSIAWCDVRLEPLTILVGPNGSGKSNFLDALAFLARALATTPAQAIDEHGGLGGIIRRVPDRAATFSIRVDAVVPWFPNKATFSASYAIEIGPAQSSPRYEIIRESCILHRAGTESHFTVARGHGDVTAPGSTRSALVAPGRLLLQAGNLPPLFQQLYLGLSSLSFYNFDTETLRRPQPSATRPALESNGKGIGDVFSALDTGNAEYKRYKARIDSYMSAILKNTSVIESRSVGDYMTVALRTEADGREFEFGSLAMSDGTIRAAAVLAAIFQPEALDGRLPLLGIEEPETALHPSAAGVLFDALSEASEHVQIITASQSADLLDREDLDASIIRPVAMRDGLTYIGEVDAASREIANEKLYTLGELMRSNQLLPQPPDGTMPEA